MYEPDVTVITPTYNVVENNLTDDFTLLIDLLDRQTYPYIEHLIMDNSSTDDTVSILKEYKNSGFINFFSEPDRGKFDAMNKGVMRAKGKYVSFLSCDDFYHDITGIADVVNVMEAEDADFCFFPSYCRHPEGYVFQFNPAIYNTFQVSPCPRQAMFFKRSVLEEVGYFDVKFQLLADYDLIIRLLLGEYKGIFFDNNIVTCKLGEQVMKYTVQAEAECRHIYHQNYKNLYPMTDEVIDRIIKFAQIPPQLLNKLSAKFPPEDKNLFMERYEQMYNMRTEAYKNVRENERRNRRNY